MPLSLVDLRSVQWSQSFRWEARFLDFPPPFHRWFPATEVKENTYVITPYDITAGQSSYSLPKETTQFDLSITYMDDIVLDIERFMEYWTNTGILNHGAGVTPLRELVKNCEVVKYDNLNRLFYYALYRVYPKDSGFFSGTSTPGFHSNEISLVIAETVRREYGSPSED